MLPTYWSLGSVAVLLTTDADLPIYESSPLDIVAKDSYECILRDMPFRLNCVHAFRHGDETPLTQQAYPHFELTILKAR